MGELLREEADQLFFRHGPGVVKALDHVGAAALHVFGLGFRFHALHNEPFVQTVEQGDQCTEHQIGPLVLRRVLHQTAVDFDEIERIVQHTRKVGVSCAEVVHVQFDADGRQRGELLLGMGGVVEQEPFRDLDFDAGGIDLIGRQILLSNFGTWPEERSLQASSTTSHVRSSMMPEPSARGMKTSGEMGTPL